MNKVYIIVHRPRTYNMRTTLWHFMRASEREEEKSVRIRIRQSKKKKTTTISDDFAFFTLLQLAHPRRKCAIVDISYTASA